MQEPPVQHTHRDGTTHSHATAIVPAAVELLQQLEDFAAGLAPDGAAALLRLVRSGLIAEAGEQVDGADRPRVYQPDWYRAFVATHHEHPRRRAPPTADGDTYPYQPAWWPARTGRPGAVRQNQ